MNPVKKALYYNTCPECEKAGIKFDETLELASDRSFIDLKCECTECKHKFMIQYNPKEICNY